MKRILLPLAALCAAAGPSALYGARTSLVLPFRDEAFFTQHLPQVVEQMVAVFKAVPALTLRALLRFPRMLWENLWPALPMLLLLLALLAAGGFFVWNFISEGSWKSKLSTSQ